MGQSLWLWSETYDILPISKIHRNFTSPMPIEFEPFGMESEQPVVLGDETSSPARSLNALIKREVSATLKGDEFSYMVSHGQL